MRLSDIQEKIDRQIEKDYEDQLKMYLKKPAVDCQAHKQPSILNKERSSPPIVNKTALKYEPSNKPKFYTAKYKHLNQKPVIIHAPLQAEPKVIEPKPIQRPVYKPNEKFKIPEPNKIRKNMKNHIFFNRDKVKPESESKQKITNQL